MNNQAIAIPAQTLGIQSKRDEWEKKKDLLKRTVCKGSTDEQFQLFLHACERTGLDPFMRQIYAVMRYDSKEGKKAMTIQTGIDGYRLIAERTGKYSPGRDATYVYDDQGRPFCATAYIKKQTCDGTWHEVSSSAYLSEYMQTDKYGKPSSFWSKMPHTMLAKCAEALSLRKAFPAELSGIYTSEEMAQADVAQEEVQEEVQQVQVITRCDFAKCQELAKKVWEGLRQGMPQLPENPRSELAYYLYNFQKNHPDEDISVRFSKPCANAETFLKTISKWYSSKDGEAAIEEISHIEYHKNQAKKSESDEFEIAG